MVSNKSPKSQSVFFCKDCDYKCYKKSDYNKHLSTKKHHMITNGVKKIATFDCDCGKSFKYRQGLSRHKQSCVVINNVIQQEPTKPCNIDSTIILQLLKENGEFKSLLMEQQKQVIQVQTENNQLQTENNQLQKQLLDVVKDGKLGNTNNTTNITNNNQRFNLNFFLNEQCKDAMNIEDFINSLQLELEDLTETKRLGFVQGISRIFTNKLQELDIYSRPLHCTDIKRETVYIKDDNQWEKDNHNKDKLKSIVNKVANKNYRQLSKWQEKHPNYLTMDTQDCDDFMDISCKALGGKNNNEDDKFKQRIMKNVLKEVTLDKI